ncbi:unnamed protein product [Amoebophrya sp. A120]|nr:unnamed protein product [Amoebophrya sp. A120]|eukprot:GSA120T00003950001.1
MGSALAVDSPEGALSPPRTNASAHQDELSTSATMDAEENTSSGSATGAAGASMDGSHAGQQPQVSVGEHTLTQFLITTNTYMLEMRASVNDLKRDLERMKKQRDHLLRHGAGSLRTSTPNQNENSLIDDTSFSTSVGGWVAAGSPALPTSRRCRSVPRTMRVRSYPSLQVVDLPLNAGTEDVANAGVISTNHVDRTDSQTSDASIANLVVQDVLIGAVAGAGASLLSLATANEVGVATNSHSQPEAQPATGAEEDASVRWADDATTLSSTSTAAAAAPAQGGSTNHLNLFAAALSPEEGVLLQNLWSFPSRFANMLYLVPSEGEAPVEQGAGTVVQATATTDASVANEDPPVPLSEAEEVIVENHNAQTGPSLVTAGSTSAGGDERLAPATQAPAAAAGATTGAVADVASTAAPVQQGSNQVQDRNDQSASTTSRADAYTYGDRELATCLVGQLVADILTENRAAKAGGEGSFSSTSLAVDSHRLLSFTFSSNYIDRAEGVEDNSTSTSSGLDDCSTARRGTNRCRSLQNIALGQDADRLFYDVPASLSKKDVKFRVYADPKDDAHAFRYRVLQLSQQIARDQAFMRINDTVRMYNAAEVEIKTTKKIDADGTTTENSQEKTTNDEKASTRSPARDIENLVKFLHDMDYNGTANNFLTAFRDLFPFSVSSELSSVKSDPILKEIWNEHSRQNRAGSLSSSSGMVVPAKHHQEDHFGEKSSSSSFDVPMAAREMALNAIHAHKLQHDLENLMLEFYLKRTFHIPFVDDNADSTLPGSGSGAAFASGAFGDASDRRRDSSSGEDHSNTPGDLHGDELFCAPAAVQEVARSSSSSSFSANKQSPSDQNTLCCVCWTHEKEFALLPCCHLAFCKHCLTETIRTRGSTRPSAMPHQVEARVRILSQDQHRSGSLEFCGLKCPICRVSAKAWLRVFH